MGVVAGVGAAGMDANIGADVSAKSFLVGMVGGVD